MPFDNSRQVKNQKTPHSENIHHGFYYLTEVCVCVGALCQYKYMIKACLDWVLVVAKAVVVL